MVPSTIFSPSSLTFLLRQIVRNCLTSSFAARWLQGLSLAEFKGGNSNMCPGEEVLPSNLRNVRRATMRVLAPGVHLLVHFHPIPFQSSSSSHLSPHRNETRSIP